MPLSEDTINTLAQCAMITLCVIVAIVCSTVAQCKRMARGVRHTPPPEDPRPKGKP